MWQKIIELLGDRLFVLRGGWERWRRQRAEPKAEAPRPLRTPLSFGQLKDPKYLRRLLNENAAVVALVALLLLGIAGYYLFAMTASPPVAGVAPVYYMDLTNGQLFVGPSNQIPPIDTPGRHMKDGQPAGVRAFVVSCGDCDSPAQRVIAYLESSTPERKRAMTQPAPPSPVSVSQPATMPWVPRHSGHVVARADLAGGWLDSESDEGLRLINEARRPCAQSGNPPRICQPR